MCARYFIKKNNKGIEEALGPTEWIDSGEGWSDTRIVPRKFAPVLFQEKGKRIIRPMLFSLIPTWAKSPKDIKFATYNARLDSVEKPTWKRPFQTQRCLIPLSSFYEPIYKGKFAGHWVQFEDAKVDLLVAAGIYDTWVDKKTGEVLYSFSMITDDPYPEVKVHGHPRSPLFLDEGAWQNWISEEKQELDALQTFAKKHKYFPKIKASEDEAMKAGWEKRIPKD